MTQLGPGVEELEVGDLVACMGPTHFATLTRIPQWACQKLQVDEDPEVSYPNTFLELYFRTRT